MIKLLVFICINIIYVLLAEVLVCSCVQISLWCHGDGCVVFLLSSPFSVALFFCALFGPLETLGRGFASSRELPHFAAELATLGAERKKASAERKNGGKM